MSIDGAEHVVVFGGEVDPSEKGHEGAGGFTNDVTVFSLPGGEPVEVTEADPVRVTPSPPSFPPAHRIVL